MRVASSDWWPSRMVVSVIKTRFCPRIQSANPFGPEFASSRCLVPSTTGCVDMPTRGAAASAAAMAGPWSPDGR
jgi:hypothetical protein